MKISILYFDDCPNHQPAVKLMRDATADLGVEAEIEEVKVDTPEDARRLCFLGSPTIQIDGMDVEPNAQHRIDYGMSCRVYNGAGLPSRKDIAGALRSASIQSRKGFWQGLVGVLTLFTTSGTLLCCALPAAIATLAGGSTVVAMTSTFPWMVPLSKHKEWIFLSAALMLVLNGFLVFRPTRAAACDISGGEGCKTAGRYSRYVFWISVAIVVVGAFFAYAIVPVLRWLEG